MNFEKHSSHSKNQPEAVKKAIAQGDKERLSAMGRRGAEIANDNRAILKEFGDELALKEEALVKQELAATNEDILPFNPDDEHHAA